MRIASIAAISLAFASVTIAAESIEQQTSLSLEATYTGETWGLEADDIRSHWAYIDHLDLTATLDGEVLFGIPNFQLFAYAIYDNGHVINEGVGDTLQGISNIESTRAFKMYEAWAQWRLGSFVSLRAGLYDLNSEFDAIENAGLFINPSHGIGAEFAQSGLNGPSIFPTTSLAARASAELGDWTVQFAVLDAVPGDLEHPDRARVRWDSSEGALYVGEVSHRIENGPRFGAGYWRYSEAFETFATNEGAVALTTSDGAYVLAETAGFSLPRGKLRGFTRAGWANARVNTIGNYIGAGATWSGFARQVDELGFAIAHARVGAPWRDAQRAEGVETEHAEVILEITARMPIGEHIVVQPDAQYVRQPGALTERHALWAFGLRLEIGLGFAR